MTRASKICSDPQCPNLQPCPTHFKEPWSGSKRKERIACTSGRKRSGSREQKQARFIMRKYDGICYVCDKPGADEVDHVDPLCAGGADTLANKRPIHTEPCHQNKTQAEAARARA